MAKLNIVGVGPGSAEYVTPAARKTVEQAYIVIGAQRSIALFVDDIKGEALVLTAKNLKDTLRQAAAAVREGKSVALLSTGDPGFSGLLHTVKESGLFNEADLNVIAGVSSIQACAARLNLSWDSARFFTFHEGTVTEEEKETLVAAVKNGKNVLLLPSSKGFAPRDIAAFLISSGTDKQTQIYVCENITLENEKITTGTLEEIASQTFGALCVMVIKQSQ